MDLRERRGDDAPTRRHPWETARARFFIELLQQHELLAGAPRVLDVGAGDAWLLNEALSTSREATGVAWDLHYSDADRARLTTVKLTAVSERPLGLFDVALLLDVIEHVEDDVGLLVDVRKLMRGGSRMLVSVPAWPALFSEHDRQLLHHRRYTPARCRRALQAAGLEVEESGGLFHALLLPRALQVAREKVLGPPPHASVGDWRGGALVTRAITTVLRAEQAVSSLSARAGVDVPGLSFWALCRVPR